MLGEDCGFILLAVDCQEHLHWLVQKTLQNTGDETGDKVEPLHLRPGSRLSQLPSCRRGWEDPSLTRKKLDIVLGQPGPSPSGSLWRSRPNPQGLGHPSLAL